MIISENQLFPGLDQFEFLADPLQQLAGIGGIVLLTAIPLLFQQRPHPQKQSSEKELNSLKNLSQNERVKLILKDTAPQAFSAAVAAVSFLFLKKTEGLTFAANLASTFFFGSIVKNTFKDAAKKAKGHSGQLGENIALATLATSIITAVLLVDKIVFKALY